MINGIFPMIGIAVFLVIVAVAVYLNVRRRSDPLIAIQTAERALGAGQQERARAEFVRAVHLLDAGKRGDRMGLIIQACLRLGELDESAGRKPEAFGHYKRARGLGAQLSGSAVRLIAECYAAENSTEDDAIETYLTYVKDCAATGEQAERVYAALQAVCKVSEETKSAPRKAAAGVLRRVIAHRPELEWAHYYLGLTDLLDGRAAEALVSFESARKLNPTRALTSYWLCVCLLQHTPPRLDHAIDRIEVFLKHPQQDRKHSKREGKACFEIAKGLVQTLGGFDAARDWTHQDVRTTLERAVHYLEIAAERLPDNSAVQFSLARALERADRIDGMMEALARAAELAPEEKQYAYHLGAARKTAGDLTGAAAALRRAIALDPNYSDALVSLADILVTTGDYAPAELLMRTALRVSESTPQAVSLLLQALFGQNKHDTVVRELGASPARGVAAKKDKEAAFVIARSQALLRRFDEAIEWLQMLRNEDRGQYYLGCAHANANRLSEACVFFNGLVDREGLYRIRAATQRGHVFFAQSKLGDAEKDYRAVQGMGGDGPEVRFALGLIAFKRDHLDLALQLLMQTVQDQPGNGRALLTLGLIHERRGETAEAVGFYTAAARDADVRPAANLRAGVLQCRMGRYDAAIQSLDDPARGDSLLFHRGMALAQSDRFADALWDWAELYSRHQNHERLLLNICIAYYLEGRHAFENGRVHDAVVSWTEYLKLDHKDAKVKRDLAELYFRLAATELASPADRDQMLQVKKLLDHAILLEPVNDTYSYYSAVCHLALGQFETSLQQFRKLMDTQGRQSRLLYHSALCLLSSGDGEGARELLIELLNHERRDGYTAYGAWALANENLRLGRTTEALAILSGVQPEHEAVVA